jgi:hypothetical protein
VVRGTGAVTRVPHPNGNGLAFTKGGQQNTNTAFLSFSGTAVASLFKHTLGDLSFSVKSNHSLEDRRVALPMTYFFHADNGSQRIAYMSSSVAGSRLVFRFGAGGGGGYYYVPAGQENALFGKGAIARFRLTWNGSRLTLYVNDVSVASFAYKPLTAAWSSKAAFAIGASSANVYSGGYYACDDSIADFRIQ